MPYDIHPHPFHHTYAVHCRMAREACALDQAGITLLKTAMEWLQLSARAYSWILKVALTAADLGRSPVLRIEDLSEAIYYRNLDR